MKKYLILIALCVTTTLAFAQNALKIGEKQLNAGFGLFGKGTAIYAGMDFGILEDISAGGEISLQSRSDRFGFGKIKYKGFGLGANANYHFNRILQIEETWDVYAGLTLNYYNWNTEVIDFSGNPYNYSGVYDYDSGFGIDVQIGGRYFFNEKFGVNVELGGLSFSGGKLGVTYKF